MTDSSITNAPLKDLLDTYAAKIQEFNAWPDGWRAERRLAAREAVEAYVGELEKEIKARGEIYGAMCDRLHACCQKYHLGLGGEHVDRLVVEEVDRLRALETRVFQFVAMGEPITVEAFSDLAPHD